MTDMYDQSERVFPGNRHVQAGAITRTRIRHAGESARGVTHFHGGLPLRMLEGHPVAPTELKRLKRQLLLKRVLLDVPLAVLALLALSPMLIAIALIIRLTSPGPMMFRQKRVGLDGREFDIFKFRSMRYDESDVSGVKQTSVNDGRVTPIGRFIRASSIDELPQLWNILVGDMSVVGPRPMVKGQLAGGLKYRDAVPYYDYRHQVRPGLSGWAQVNGLRGPTTDETSARLRIDYDCAYVQNVSLRLDLRIILDTVKSEFLTGTGS